MLPLTTKCVRGKSSSSAVLRFAVGTLPNGNALGNATSGRENVSEARAASAHCCSHCQHVVHMVMRWGLLPRTQCVRGKSSSSAVLVSTIVSLPMVNALGNATSGHDMGPRQE